MKPAPAKTKKIRKPTRDAEGSILKRIEQRSTSNGKTRNETIYYARVRMNEYDDDGRFVKMHERKRRADSYQDAVILRRYLRLQLKADIEKAKREDLNSRVYFFDLLDFYEKHYVKEAVFSGTKKIAGQRSSVVTAKQQIKTFRDFFGNVPVSQITYSRIFNYKLAMSAEQYKVVRRVETDTIGRRRVFEHLEEWRDRKPATIHRYLARLRRILYVGVQQGFATVNPFTQGDPLIESATEQTRVRICTFEEEEKLLSLCTGRRKHLADVIVCAIDTFLRRNELFSLIGSNVNFEERFVTIVEYNAKTAKERTVPLSDRAYEAFGRLRGDRPDEEWNDSRVFPMSSVKTAWYGVLRDADIEGLRFHDLRGTGITRMLDAGVPAPIVMRYSGHDQYETFMKYVRTDLRIIQDAGNAMSELYQKRKAEMAKGQRPLAEGHEASPEESKDVTDLGDALN